MPGRTMVHAIRVHVLRWKNKSSRNAKRGLGGQGYCQKQWGPMKTISLHPKRECARKDKRSNEMSQPTRCQEGQPYDNAGGGSYGVEVILFGRTV